MHYYKFNIGDYRRDTSHLTMLEHGAYRQLLDSYYMNEQPLTLDDASLMRTHSARSAEEMQAIKNVLQDFFTRTESGWVHNACDRVIAEYHGKSDKARESAKARWASKHVGSSERTAYAMRTHSEGNANHKPITNNHNKNTNAQPYGFAEFWTSYPKKKNKGDAEKAWKAIKPDAELIASIMAALVSAKNGKDWQKDGGQFIPYPASWLRAKGWEDESDTAKPENMIPFDRDAYEAKRKAEAAAARERMRQEQADWEARQA